MSQIRIVHAPPKAGWLTLQLWVNGQVTEIDASDVPNNPINELAEAIGIAAEGRPAVVWWHLEPDGYFMHFIPKGAELELRLDFANNSE